MLEEPKAISPPTLLKISQSRLLLESVVAGGLGALTIVLWFLILDSIQGHPFYTPTVLGTALFEGGASLAAPGAIQISMGTVLLYTLVHFAAFCGLGYVAARLFVVAEQHPPFIFGLLLFLLLFLAGFLYIMPMFAEPVLNLLTVSAVGIGNVLAASAMCGYLWRRHPLDLRQLM